MPDFTDGDLLINDGDDYTNGAYYPKEPVEQVQEQQAKDAVKATSYPVMDDVADWFTQQIAACDSLDNIQMTTQTFNGVKYDRKTSVEAQLLAYQLLKAALQSKAQEFKEFGNEL